MKRLKNARLPLMVLRGTAAVVGLGLVFGACSAVTQDEGPIEPAAGSTPAADSSTPREAPTLTPVPRSAFPEAAYEACPESPEQFTPDPFCINLGGAASPQVIGYSIVVAFLPDGEIFEYAVPPDVPAFRPMNPATQAPLRVCDHSGAVKVDVAQLWNDGTESGLVSSAGNFECHGS